MSSRTSQWHSVSQVRGRGGKGRRLSPFPPAHRLIQLHCAHREYCSSFLPAFSLFLRVPRFPVKNFVPGSPKSDDSQLRGPIASAALASCWSRQREFIAKLFSPANSASWCCNLGAKDDPGSACAPLRTMEPRPCLWRCPPLCVFWLRQALGRRGVPRGSTPP